MKMLISILLLAGTLLGGNEVLGDEYISITITEQNENGIPTKTTDSVDNVQIFPHGMFCLPKLELGATCTEKLNQVFWEGENFLEKTDTRVAQRVQDMFVLVITRMVGVEDPTISIINCLYQKSRGTIACKRIPPPPEPEQKAALPRGLFYSKNKASLLA